MNENNTIVQLNNYPHDKYNVLIPVRSMQVLSNMHKIIVNEVLLDTNLDENGKVTGNDIYKEKSSGKYAVTKVGGTKLAAAANISVVSSEEVTPDVCEKCVKMAQAIKQAPQCGNCSHQYDVKYLVTVRVPEPGGGFRLISKSKEIDCELTRAEMKKRDNYGKEAEYNRFLPHRKSICESKAFMRCVRDALGLAAGYTIEEIRKPFVIAHVVPNLDNPVIQTAIASNYLASMGMLFENPDSQKALTTPEPSENYNRQDVPALPAATEDYSEADYANGEPEPDKIVCADCQQEVVGGTAADGRPYTAKEVADYSISAHGRFLCNNCMKKGGTNP
jgi:hypothetical protein